MYLCPSRFLISGISFLHFYCTYWIDYLENTMINVFNFIRLEKFDRM